MRIVCQLWWILFRCLIHKIYFFYHFQLYFLCVSISCCLLDFNVVCLYAEPFKLIAIIMAVFMWFHFWVLWGNWLVLCCLILDIFFHGFFEIYFIFVFTIFIILWMLLSWIVKNFHKWINMSFWRKVEII